MWSWTGPLTKTEEVALEEEEEPVEVVEEASLPPPHVNPPLPPVAD